LILAAAAALTAAAADVTGKWTGTFTPDNGEAQPALLVLKQSGTAITGTAGPDENQQWPIKTGMIDGAKVVFEVAPDEGRSFKFELVLDGDHLKGDLNGTHDGEVMKAKLDVSRAK